MRALFTLLLASGIYCRSLKSAPYQQQLLQLTDELPNAVDESSYLDNSALQEYAGKNFGPELYEKLHKYYALLQEKMDRSGSTMSELDKAVYFFIKTMKQRNKRYTKYLTFCHFKICNIGKKRNTRYVQMFKSMYDDDHT